MMEMAPNIDHAVLFSGDGDFRQLLEAVQRRGVRVTVISTFRAQSPMVSDELRRQADIHRIARPHQGHRPQGPGYETEGDIPDFVKKPAARNPTPADPEPGFDEDDDIYEDA